MRSPFGRLSIRDSNNNRWKTLKVDHGHWRRHSSTGHHLLLVVCSNYVSILYRFWDIQRLIMAVNSDKNRWKTLKVDHGHWRRHSSTGHHLLLVVCSNHVSILYRFWDIQRLIMAVNSDKNRWKTLKVDHGHWRRHSSTGRHLLLVVCSNHVSILYRFWDIQRLIMAVRGH